MREVPLATTTTGVPTLDALLGDGLVAGDNVVLLSEADDLDQRFALAFVGADPERSAWATFGEPPEGLDPAVEVLVLGPEAVDDVETGAAAITALATARPRIVVGGLEVVHERAGPAAAVETYRRCCPRLFDMGAVACWPVHRELVGATVTTKIGRIAQVVLELRRDALRVAKAEGRNGRLQGALAELHQDGPDGRPRVGRDLVAGRLGEGLKKLRRERNLTQRQLAALADVTPGAISQAEAGRRGLSLETLVVLCDAVGTGLDDLLGTAQTQGHVLTRRDGRPVHDGSVALFDGPGDGIAVYRVELEPGERGRPPFAHKGPELVLVARGLVLVDLGDDTPVMRTGDALRVVAEPIDGWMNLGTEVAELFWLAEQVTL
jgi:transcriptional regulator with XRE-family HTH domain